MPMSRAKDGNHVCPVCGSGSGKNGTSAFHEFPPSKTKSGTWRFQCYAGDCFTDRGQDTLEALKTIWKCSESEAMIRAGYSIEPDKDSSLQARKTIQAVQEADQDYTEYYKKCHDALKSSSDGLEYLYSRGITNESIDRFNLGYDATWKHPKAPNTQPTPRIIVPRTAASYMARLTREPLNEYENSHKKPVTKQDLFNADAIKGADLVIVCEGELDAISLLQAGATNVVGLGALCNAKKFVDAAKGNPDAMYILALDNDADKEDGSNPGKEAQKKLRDALTAEGLNAAEANNLYGSCKDANEAYLKDSVGLMKRLDLIRGHFESIQRPQLEERKEERKKRTGAGMMVDFLNRVGKETYKPIPTGIKKLDKILDGGFKRGTLVMLGAGPGMGKTTLAQWVFENMAADGQDVLYINLEMSRDQLLAKSIARLCWTQYGYDTTASKVLRGYEWMEDLTASDIIMSAANDYAETIAERFTYNPDGVTNHIDSILQAMKTETMEVTSQGRKAPIICVDYLQLVATEDRDAMETVKTVMSRLKTFAIENNTVIFVIMANNRGANKTGTTDLESGRDSSAIEYGADIMLGLSYSAIEDHRKTQDKIMFIAPDGSQAETVEAGTPYTLDLLRRIAGDARDHGQPVPRICNEVSLTVLKGRFEETNARVRFIFDGRHSTYSII